MHSILKRTSLPDHDSFNCLKHVLLAFILLSLAACATGGLMDQDVYQMHSFSFDVRQDMPDIEVLDYQYSNSRNIGIKPEAERVSIQSGKGGFWGDGISGNLLRGDFLYVKWRIKKPDAPAWAMAYLGTYEDRVDLRSRLPADITDLRIHFIIRGTQLYVYLIWPGLKDASIPKGPVEMYPHQKQVQIYPDVPK